MQMNVGAASEAAGVSAKAVRLWESKALLPPAQRSAAGYRVFTEEDVVVLRFIRQAKALGLTLSEIKDVLDLQRCGAVPCERVTTLLDAHIARIDRNLADLRTMRRTLLEARQAARDGQRRGDDSVICRIIETA